MGGGEGGNHKKKKKNIMKDTNYEELNAKLHETLIAGNLATSCTELDDSSQPVAVA